MVGWNINRRSLFIYNRLILKIQYSHIMQLDALILMHMSFRCIAQNSEKSMPILILNHSSLHTSWNLVWEHLLNHF
uniref:Uncharacterized protein n=1 Tax=Anguilla anguilla TaxID=7936 RepID=A0A0E9X0P8_ANGAN